MREFKGVMEGETRNEKRTHTYINSCIHTCILLNRGMYVYARVYNQSLTNNILDNRPYTQSHVFPHTRRNTYICSYSYIHLVTYMCTQKYRHILLFFPLFLFFPLLLSLPLSSSLTTRLFSSAFLSLFFSYLISFLLLPSLLLSSLLLIFVHTDLRILHLTLINKYKHSAREIKQINI